MLVDQHPIVRRDHPATLAAHGGLSVQNGVFETDNDVLVRALVLQMPAHIAPPCLKLGHSFGAVTGVVDIHRRKGTLRGRE